MATDPDIFKHDLLNRIGAAKMNAELAARSLDIPESVRKNLSRVITNLNQIQEMVEGQSSFPSEPVNMPATQARLVVEAHVILLIDDSDDLRAMFTAVFKPRGYRVFVAGDEAEALAVLASAPLPELVLVDYRLGERTGVDVLNTIEKSFPQVLSESKVVLFTGLEEPSVDARFHAVELKAMDLASLIRIVEKYTTIAQKS